MSAEEALEALRRSHAWDSLSLYVRRAQPSEDWRDGCWRFLAFPAEYSGRGATAIFGVHVPPGGKQVRGALVDERVQEILRSET